MNETKKCPYCGEEILVIAKKCKHCGEWLNQDKTCPICGETIPWDADVCPICGEEVVSSQQVQTIVNTSQQQVINTQPTITQPVVKTESVISSQSANNSANSSSSDDEKSEEKGFFEYYFKDNFTNLHFEGNTPQRQYWMGCLAFAMINILFWFCVSGVVVFTDNIIPLFIGYSIYTIAAICAIPMLVRRLHDVGKKGWYYWMILIPIAGPIILLLALAKKGITNSLEVTINIFDKVIFGLTALALAGSFLLVPKMGEVVSNYLFGTTDNYLEEYETSSSLSDSNSDVSEENVSDLDDDYIEEQLKAYILCRANSNEEDCKSVELSNKAQAYLYESTWPEEYCTKEETLCGVGDDLQIIEDSPGVYHFECTCKECGQEHIIDNWHICATLRPDGIVEINEFYCE